MAKKKLSGKKQKIDWKFVALVLGIILVGMSVFVLNQKMTYKSSAQWTSGQTGLNCNKMFRDCLSDCNSIPRIRFFEHDGNPNTDPVTNKGACKSNCSNVQTRCKELNRTLQTTPQGAIGVTTQ